MIRFKGPMELDWGTQQGYAIEYRVGGRLLRNAVRWRMTPPFIAGFYRRPPRLKRTPFRRIARARLELRAWLTVRLNRRSVRRPA